MQTIHDIVLTCLVITLHMGSLLYASAIKFEIKNSGQQLMSNRSEHNDLAQARNTALVQIVEPEHNVSMEPYLQPYLKVLTKFLNKEKRGSPCVIQNSLHQTSTNKVTDEVWALINKYGDLDSSHHEGDKAYYRIKVKDGFDQNKLNEDLAEHGLESNALKSENGYIVNFAFAVPKVTTIQEVLKDKQMQPFVGISSPKKEEEEKSNAVSVFLNVALEEGVKETETNKSGIICAFKSTEAEFEDQRWEWYLTRFDEAGVPHKEAATQGSRYEDAALYSAAVGLTPVENRKNPYLPDGLSKEQREQKDEAKRKALVKRAHRVAEEDLMKAEIFVRSHGSVTGATTETEGYCEKMFEELGM